MRRAAAAAAERPPQAGGLLDAAHRAGSRHSHPRRARALGRASVPGGGAGGKGDGHWREARSGPSGRGPKTSESLFVPRERWRPANAGAKRSDSDPESEV